MTFRRVEFEDVAPDDGTPRLKIRTPKPSSALAAAVAPLVVPKTIQFSGTTESLAAAEPFPISVGYCVPTKILTQYGVDPGFPELELPAVEFRHLRCNQAGPHGAVFELEVFFGGGGLYHQVGWLSSDRPSKIEIVTMLCNLWQKAVDDLRDPAIRARYV